MTTSNPILARFAGEPALVEPSQVMRFEANLNALNGVELPVASASASDDFWTELGDHGSKLFRPYCVEDGLLTIPVKGVLLKDFPYQYGSWATGYEYIRAALQRGVDDSNVTAIAFIIDSPGGMVAGNFDLVDEIYATRGTKPIFGYANESAYSAAYSIISAVDPGRLYVARTGGVGSIGVVCDHMNVAGAMEKAGLAFTYIYAGKHKVDGNPYEALSPEVKARMQARIDSLYAVFVSTVARNRGMSEQAVRDTEALTFGSEEAVSNGLADQIGTLEDMTAAHAACLDDQSETEGEDEMTTTVNSAVDQAAVDAARAEGHAAGMQEGMTAERSRIGGILALDEAKGRGDLAAHLAMNTDMSVDAAKGVLAASPVAAAAAPAAPAAPVAQSFGSAMDSTGNPGITAEQQPGAEQPVNRAAALMALGAKMGVKGFTAPSKE